MNVPEDNAPNLEPLPTGQLFEQVYDQLRVLARAKMSKERGNHTLSATALVNEAFLRLDGAGHWDSNPHFFAAAAESMRRILIDQARARLAAKRGGDQIHELIELDSLPVFAKDDDRLIQLNDAIDQLTQQDPVKSQLVKLRYFAGLTTKEAAEMMEISTATADRYWAYARAWLQTKIQGEGD